MSWHGQLQGCPRVSLVSSYPPVASDYPALLSYDAPPQALSTTRAAAIVTASSRSLHLADQGKKLIGVTQYHLPFHHSALFLFPAQHPPSLEAIQAFHNSVHSVGTSSKFPEVLSGFRFDAGQKSNSTSDRRTCAKSSMNQDPACGSTKHISNRAQVLLGLGSNEYGIYDCLCRLGR